MTATYAKWRRLASAALTHAIDGKYESANTVNARMREECPDHCLDALIAWCDTAIDHATDGHPAVMAEAAGVAAVAIETGKIGTDVPARVAWAHRLLHARCRMDQAAWNDAIAEVREFDKATQASHLGAVLEAAALTIRSLPRGYMALGRSQGGAR